MEFQILNRRGGPGAVRLVLATVLGMCVAACGDFERDINVSFPPRAPELVVECYLQPDSLIRLSLTQTFSYYEPPTQIPAVAGATVFIRYQGDTIPLRFSPAGNDSNRYFLGEYRADRVCPADFDNPFELFIRTADGRTASAVTRIQRPITIDSVTYDFLGGDAQVVIWFPDPDRSATNYYLTQYDNGNRDSARSFTRSDFPRGGAAQDYTFGQPLYQPGDTVEARIAHINRDFYDYYESVERARANNGNPFAEPGTILSNIRGGIGIFTGYVRLQQAIVIGPE